jgi:transcription antitermination factor NusG
MTTTRWYCLRTAPKREPLVTTLAESFGFAVGAPTVLVKMTGNPGHRSTLGVIRAPSVKRVPMFPSYLFVAFDATDPGWRRLATLPGVQKIFGATPDRPTPLPVGQVEDFLLQPEDALSSLYERPRVGVGVGARGRVVDGAFEGHEGVCCLSTDERVTLLLELMGSPRPVAFPSELVEAVR